MDISAWLPLALLTALCLAGYNFFIKLSADELAPALGAVVLQVVAALLGALWLLKMRWQGQSLGFSGKGLGLAALAGLGVGVAEILTFVLYQRGLPASVGTPVIVGGSVLLTAVLGAVVLRESLSLGQASGLLFIVAGIALLARGH
ncbi:MAG: EamA family transporter [Bacteroidota bacterium]|nr:EamA family transporter [Bacteroidota bacterium]